MYLLVREKEHMLDFSHYVTISTSQGRLLQAPPPRARLLALPAPTPKITGFLADGLPAILKTPRFPRTVAEFEAMMYAIGYQTPAEMDAELAACFARSDARIERFIQSYAAQGGYDHASYSC